MITRVARSSAGPEAEDVEHDLDAGAEARAEGDERPVADAAGRARAGRGGVLLGLIASLLD